VAYPVPGVYGRTRVYNVTRDQGTSPLPEVDLNEGRCPLNRVPIDYQHFFPIGNTAIPSTTGTVEVWTVAFGIVIPNPTSFVICVVDVAVRACACSRLTVRHGFQRSKGCQVYPVMALEEGIVQSIFTISVLVRSRKASVRTSTGMESRLVWTLIVHTFNDIDFSLCTQ
jgi:hypothetical protein